MSTVPQNEGSPTFAGVGQPPFRRAKLKEMPQDDTSTDAKLAAFSSTLGSMAASTLDKGGDPEHWNRLVNELQRLQLDLRTTEEGRAGISRMMNSEDPTVRCWSATFALFWDEAEAREVLLREVAAKGVEGFEAKITLREFDAGRLTMTWQPPPR